MKKTVLVVDDEPDIIFSIQEGLEDLKVGYRIVSAESGEECIKLLKNNQIPDAILLDIMMPEMNGWVLYDILKSNASWRDSPVGFPPLVRDAIEEQVGTLGNSESEVVKNIVLIYLTEKGLLSTGKKNKGGRNTG